MDPRETIARTLRAGGQVLIVCHLGPDGDCLGAGLALAGALERIGVDATVACEDGVPGSLAFLPGAGRVVRGVPDTLGVPVAVALECSTLDRAGGLAPALERAGTLIAIDHHSERPQGAQLMFWDPDAAAVGELVMDLVARLGVAFDRPIATCLLAALVTDTGAFRYANTTPRTLRLAAELIDWGANLGEVVRAVYEEQPASAVRLLGHALAASLLHDGGAVAMTVVTPAMLASAGAGPDDLTGIGAALRTISGVRLAVVLEDRGSTVRVSIRTRDGVRADLMAHSLGGGGHARAAGAEMSCGIEEALARVREAASRAVRLVGDDA